MKKMLLSIAVTLFVLGAGGGVYVYANEEASFSGIVERFISLGIIPTDQAEKARRAVAGLVGTDVTTPEQDEVMNSEHVEVKVSQYIEHAGLEYGVGEKVEGLLLVVTNTHTESVTLEAKRGCQVVYRISDDDVVLYDSRDTEKCQTDEKVVYLMEPGQVRMFPVTHDPSIYPLPAGKYDIELEYPGYGGGTRRVTIVE